MPLNTRYGTTTNGLNPSLKKLFIFLLTNNEFTLFLYILLKLLNTNPYIKFLFNEFESCKSISYFWFFRLLINFSFEYFTSVCLLFGESKIFMIYFFLSKIWSPKKSAKANPHPWNANTNKLARGDYLTLIMNFKLNENCNCWRRNFWIINILFFEKNIT